jgi:hypothetical protein
MACKAKRVSLKHVILVIGDGMLECFLFVSVKLPETQKNVIEIDHVVSVKVLGGMTLHTGESTIAFFPSRIRQ